MQHDIKFKARVALGATLLVLAVLTSTSKGEADNPAGLEIEYEGQLLDEDRKPIAGIFPLEFLLYRGESDDRAIWRETHWVAVHSGRYKVRLGSTSRIRPELAASRQDMFLGVNLSEGGELTREAIELPSPQSDKKTRDDREPDKKDEPAKVVKEDLKPPVKPPNQADKNKPSYRTESSFADKAEFATRAGVADDSEKLGGKTLKQLEDEIERLRSQLAEHRTDAGSHGGGKVTVGADTTVLPRVGGTGGGAYQHECPPGYVVTGMRGSSGALVDSFQIICSPLQ